MSGIYIPGMEMPTEGFVEILIRDDGTVLQTGQSYRIDGTDYYSPYVGETPIVYKAIPVPAHGRLVDADKMLDKPVPVSRTRGGYWLMPINFAEEVRAAPTVIPADEEAEE